MRSLIRSGVLGIAAWAASAWMPSSALACGGFFCNSAQPVNQAAEGIIFADNGDGTVTAVIQIKYQGPSQSFSWLLPISSVPKVDSDIGVASNLAFQRLQAATNPNYSLTTTIEGTCRQDNRNGGSPGSAAGGGSSFGSNGGRRSKRERRHGGGVGCRRCLRVDGDLARQEHREPCGRRRRLAEGKRLRRAQRRPRKARTVPRGRPVPAGVEADQGRGFRLDSPDRADLRGHASLDPSQAHGRGSQRRHGRHGLGARQVPRGAAELPLARAERGAHQLVQRREQLQLRSHRRSQRRRRSRLRDRIRRPEQHVQERDLDDQ